MLILKDECKVESKGNRADRSYTITIGLKIILFVVADINYYVLMIGLVYNFITDMTEQVKY